MASAASSRGSSRLRLILLLGVLLAAGIGGAAVYKRKQAEKVTAVTTEVAAIRTLTQTVTATGKIQPEVEVKIAPEVSGEVIELPFEEGDAVKRGDLLIRLKPDNYRFQVEQ